MIPWWAFIIWAVFVGLFSFWVGGAMARGKVVWWRQ